MLGRKKKDTSDVVKFRCCMGKLGEMLQVLTYEVKVAAVCKVAKTSGLPGYRISGTFSLYQSVILTFNFTLL